MGWWSVISCEKDSISSFSRSAAQVAAAALVEVHGEEGEVVRDVDPAQRGVEFVLEIELHAAAPGRERRQVPFAVKTLERPLLEAAVDVPVDDARGDLVRAKNADADVCFERDGLGRVIVERVGEMVIESRYDATGRRAEIEARLAEIERRHPNLVQFTGGARTWSTGISVAAGSTGTLAVNEGSSSTFTVKLAAQPASDVSVP